MSSLSQASVIRFKIWENNEAEIINLATGTFIVSKTVLFLDKIFHVFSFSSFIIETLLSIFSHAMEIYSINPLYN